MDEEEVKNQDTMPQILHSHPQEMPPGHPVPDSDVCHCKQAPQCIP